MQRPARSRDRGVSRSRAITAAAAAAGGAIVVIVSIVIAASMAVGPATLIVRSEPRGARVFLDDVDTQQLTPALLKGVRSGEPHKLRLTLEGHQSLSEIVTLPKKGGTEEIKLELIPAQKGGAQ